MHGTPSVLFSVNKYVNMFYHLCVLFSEYFPDEISLGILNNPVYRRKHEDLKTQKLHALFQRLQEHAFYTWDFMGLPLSETSDMASTKRILVDTSQKVAGTWFEIYQEAINDYEVIWTQTEPKLKRFASDFEAQWISIYESVSTVMSKMTKLSWKTRRVNVHLVDCIYGGSAWTRDIALPPFPDVDVEKKLLAHELVHTLVPDYYLKARLEEAGLDWNLAHTVVDLIAYFSVKEHVAQPDKRGIKPNPSYYAHVEELYPIFEECYTQAEEFQDIKALFDRIKPLIKG